MTGLRPWNRGFSPRSSSSSPSLRPVATTSPLFPPTGPDKSRRRSTAEGREILHDLQQLLRENPSMNSALRLTSAEIRRGWNAQGLLRLLSGSSGAVILNPRTLVILKKDAET